MTRKIFQNSFFVGFFVLILAAVLFFSVLYRCYEAQMFTDLRVAAEYISHGIALSGEEYLETLETENRVTWIAADGTVLHDSAADAASMENHADREEIREALEQGTGQSVHNSETLLQKTLYSAVRLEDGTVLRVSCTQSAMVAMLQVLLSSLAWITVLMLFLCGVLSFRLAQSITKPINALDLDHPMADGCYRELEPLITRLGEQNRTIRRQMEELGWRQREFAAISDNMSEGLLILDQRRNILTANRSVRQILQLPENGETILRRELCGGALFSAAESALYGRQAEALMEKAERTWQVLANPVTTDGQITGAVVILVDVTEREQREALRREFSANVSHELKTPLTSISGFAELMMEGLVPPEKTREFSADIYRESRRMIDLVDDIIKLSRLDENAGDFAREPVDLYALSGEILKSLEPAAKKRQITLELKGRAEAFVGVRQILSEMVYNLCDNAIKYNQEGGSVTVTVRRQNGNVQLSVADTGIGIPYAHQSRVFERFYRVDKSHSREIGGTGLGLSIVKHGAQYHGAQITLDSEPGHGTVVTLRFPSGKEWNGNAERNHTESGDSDLY